jgi:hypothetical protein
MRKEYIKPSIEIFASQLHSDMMAGHSFDWADAKKNEIFFEEEGDDPWDTDPWGTEYDLWNEGD